MKPSMFAAIGRLLALLVVILACQVNARAAKQPNIVFIFADDHAYQAISA